MLYGHDNPKPKFDSLDKADWPKKNHTYKERNKQWGKDDVETYTIIDLFHHDIPWLDWKHYVIYQVSGNYNNLVQIMELKKFNAEFEHAWEPLTVCKFCGFSRMMPCKTRQACPNLPQYAPENQQPYPEEIDFDGRDL